MTADDPFRRVLPLLVEEIPRALRARAKGETLCRVILWYYDTCAPCCYFLADAMCESYRSKAMATATVGKGYLTWYSGEPMPKDRVEAMIGADEMTPSFPWMAKIYQLMCADGYGDEALKRERGLVQKVCFELNGIDWSPFCSVTDDFVIYAQNGTDYYCGTDEDIAASIPVAKLDLLRSRGLL